MELRISRRACRSKSRLTEVRLLNPASLRSPRMGRNANRSLRTSAGEAKQASAGICPGAQGQACCRESEYRAAAVKPSREKGNGKGGGEKKTDDKKNKNDN